MTTYIVIALVLGPLTSIVLSCLVWRRTAKRLDALARHFAVEARIEALTRLTLRKMREATQTQLQNRNGP